MPETVIAPTENAPAATLLSSAPAETAPVASAQPAQQGSWLDSLPENLRAEPSIKVMPDLENLAKSYLATKKLVGTKLEMPGEGATPEQVESWRKTVGAPATPEGYLGDAKTLRPESIPETLWDGENEKAFLALAHKHHLPAGAVKEILAFHAETLGKGIEGAQAGEQAALATEGAKLKAAFGADFDTHMSNASRLAKTLGLDPATNPIFQSAEVVQAFAKGAKLFSEDKLVAGETRSISSTLEDRAREITDPISTAQIAREYRGEFGAERQSAAQALLHQLYAAKK